MSNLTERLVVIMLWLTLISFCAGFTLTALAAYYGSIFMALMAILSFAMGIFSYAMYRTPASFEDADNHNNTGKREALREFDFQFTLFVIAILFYSVLAKLFFNTFSNTEEILILALPLSLVSLGIVIILLV